MRILGTEHRDTGHTRVTFDAAVDRRVTVVCLTEAAHEFLALRPGEWMDTVIYQAPTRMTRVNT